MPPPTSASSAYQYVPSFLARRFPPIAALEENPIYLRESGKRYGRRWRWLRSGLFTGFGTLLDVGRSIILLILMIAVFAFILLLGSFLGCFTVLIVPIAFFAMSGAFRSGRSLSSRLEFEWQMGRLQEIYMSSLEGKDILWGYAGARILRTLKFGVPIALLLMAGYLILPFIPLYLIFDSASLHSRIPKAYVLPLELGTLAIAAQLILSSVLSTVMSTSDEINKVGARVGRRMETAISSGMESFGYLILTFLPGCIAGGLVVSLLLAPFVFRSSSTSEHVLIALMIGCFFIVYGLVNIPITILYTRNAIRGKMRAVNNDFKNSIRRLAEKEADKPRRTVFGE